MLNRGQFTLFTSEQLISYYAELYIEEYGAKKSKEVIDKSYNSPKVINYIEKLRNQRLNPGFDGFLTLLNSIPYFLFSKGETLCMGALMAIQRWANETSNDTYKVGWLGIINIVVETILKCEKTKFKRTELNLFDKYYRRLEEIIKSGKFNEDINLDE